MVHKPSHTPLHVLERRAEGIPSAKEIAEAKAAARKKDPNFSIDWADAKAVRALVEKYSTDEDGN